MNPLQVRCHLSQLLRKLEQTYGDSQAFLYQNLGSSEWQEITRKEAADKADKVSRAMIFLGIGVQENIGIFSPNSIETLITEFATWGIRATTVPIYFNDSEQELRTIVENAHIRYVFVGSQQNYDKAFLVLQTSESLERIIIIDNSVKLNKRDNTSLRWDSFMKKGDYDSFKNIHEKRLQEATGDDLMSIIYTSGTSGESKGVMLSHSQEQAAMEANDAIMDLSDKDRVLSYLPLSHILDKGWILFCMTEGCLVKIPSEAQKVVKAMTETHPTCMCSVPRFWEKVYSAFQQKISTMSAIEEILVKKSIVIGQKHNVDCLGRGEKPSKLLALQYKLSDKYVLSKLRSKLGIVNPNFYPVGGAFFAPEISCFFHSIGIYMHYGYGMTETFATLSSDVCGMPFTIGSVGRPLKEVSVRIADDGEILLKGPTISLGYYERPDLISKAYDGEGYLHTGDLGYIKDGELYLTERKKDLYKMSTGKYIAPQQIESKIIVDNFVEQVMVIADCRKFVSALIVPAFEELEKYFWGKGISFTCIEEMCSDIRVIDFYEKRITTLQHTLANFEKVKKFILLPSPFNIERGELTNTLKLKRKAILEHYNDVIGTMYLEE